MTQLEHTHTIDDLLVVKLGGGQGLDLARCADDLARLAANRPLAVVHGVSARLDALCEAQGMPVRMLRSPGGHTSRYTDAATRDLYVRAATEVTLELAGMLIQRGYGAIGLAGDDTPLYAARKTAIRAVTDGRVRIVRDDYSGTIQDVDAVRLCYALYSGYVPVIPPLARSADGLLNVDGDRAAAAIAVALGASELVILSNVRGLLRCYPDEASLVSHIPAGQVAQALGWAEGRMKRKVLGAEEALRGGVRRVVIADGRVAGPVQAALAGGGTEFVL